MLSPATFLLAKVREVDGEKLEKDIKELEVLARKMDSEGIVRKLQEMVLSYKHNRYQFYHLVGK